MTDTSSSTTTWPSMTSRRPPWMSFIDPSCTVGPLPWTGQFTVRVGPSERARSLGRDGMRTNVCASSFMRDNRLKIRKLRPFVGYVYALANLRCNRWCVACG